MGAAREALRTPGAEPAGSLAARNPGVGLENSHTIRTLIESLDAFAWQADPHTLGVSIISPNAEKVLGRKLNATSAEPESWIKHIHPDDRDDFVEALRAAAKHTGDQELEVRVIAADGTVTWLRSIVRLIRDRAGRPVLEGVTVDITDRKQVEAELHATERRYRKLAARTATLERRAFHDPLTRLPNRALWRNHLKQALRSARRSSASCAVLMLDLDDFKAINDTLGHAAGDEVLRAMAPRLQSALRDCDVVARLGGDEFVALLADTDADGAARAATRIAAALDEPLHVEGHTVSLHASMGIALFPEHARKGDELMRRADAAMYYAKQSGNGHATWGQTDGNIRGRPTRAGSAAACRVSIPVVGRAISVIALDGELDIASVGAVHQAIKRCWAELPHKLHIDCSGLTFMDPMGIRALLRAARWLQREGIGVTFEMNRQLVRMLNRVGLDDQLHPIEPQGVAAGR